MMMHSMARALLVLFLACAAVVARGAEAPADWRQVALDQVRAAAATMSAPTSDPAGIALPWRVSAQLYVGGEVVGYEAAIGSTLATAASAVGARLGRALAPGQLRDGRLFLTVRGPGANGAMVEFEGRALAVVGDVTAVPTIDRERVLATVRDQRDYLLRQVDPVHHGFFKVYSARRDAAQTHLRVTYTASALWTLLQLRELEPDPRIDAVIGPASEFLLSMQVRGGEHRGAFHYAFDPANAEKRERYVVGTTSKAVYTLLELHRRSGERRFLDAANAAGQWLLGRVQRDGRVLAVTLRSRTNGQWETPPQQSVLYSCETLSALSRLYAVTGDRPYRRAARRIAERLLQQGTQGGFVFGDDFRRPNTVSTSWVAMALLDYTVAVRDERMQRALFTAADQVLLRQIEMGNNLLDNGRYFDTWATSGNGWMNEVLVPVYQRCLDTGRGGCERYRIAMNRSARWLLQNTYTAANSYHLPNPARARGGAIRNSKVEAVRTDAVCHAANSLVGLLQLPPTTLRDPRYPL